MEEIWKEIEIKGVVYKVSNTGRVFGKTRELKQRLDKCNYPTVTIGNKNNRTRVRVHRLVLLAFNPVEGMENLEVNHKDYDRSNNNLDNLEWLTHEENVRYSREHHHEFEGSKNPKATFTEDQIRTLREMYKNGWTINQLVFELYGVTRKSDLRLYKNLHGKISDIVKYRTWKYIA